uniref:Gamma-secretase subunit APH-1 n=1 Tax=Astyanax mexicanus TaxID=7994 RepID=A0A8B9HFB9_ASTMX
MTAAVFFGCAFIAFGPAFSLFIFTIARDPLRVIILIAGSVNPNNAPGALTALTRCSAHIVHI